MLFGCNGEGGASAGGGGETPATVGALVGARRYRQVVATQSYVNGKDVFPATPVTYRYFRRPDQAYTRLDGSAYAAGDIVTERPVHLDDPASIDYRLGKAGTLIAPDRPFTAGGGTYNPDYSPLLDPSRFDQASGSARFR